MGNDNRMAPHDKGSTGAKRTSSGISRGAGSALGGKSAGKRRILLVEDDTFVSGMYVTKFTAEGFDILLANDGEEGLKKAKTAVPDLVLLDLLLPKKSGFDVLIELKSDPRLRDIPVVLLTNLSEKENVQRGLALGATDYLIKAHFMPSEVIAKIKRILRMS